MELLEKLFGWCVDHWKTITAVSVSIVAIVSTAVAGGTRLHSWLRGWQEAQRGKKNKELDSKVFQALQDPDLPRSSRGMTGAGDPLTRSADIAEALSLDQEDIVDSLGRLEARGRVRNAGGTSDNPSPCWHILH
jgi:hypothetical protein